MRFRYLISDAYRKTDISQRKPERPKKVVGGDPSSTEQLRRYEMSKCLLLLCTFCPIQLINALGLYFFYIRVVGPLHLVLSQTAVSPADH